MANLYGASYDEETIIGRALRHAASGGPISLRNLAPIRNFLHVDDAVESLIRLAVHGDGQLTCHTVNVADNHPVSILEVAQMVAEVAFEQHLGTLEILPSSVDESESIPELVLDNSRLRASIGWSPQVSLKKGLQMSLANFTNSGR
jgi:nucleoside-diphosphate-sugar epimerase